MPVNTIEITGEESVKIIKTTEGHFADVKGKAIKPAKLTKTICGFANADGGELYIGISEGPPPMKSRSWVGFTDDEEANGHLQAFEKYFPLGTDFSYDFLSCQSWRGLVLHVQVNKTSGVSKASDGCVYIRRGAQNVPVTSQEGLRRLEYLKGVVSFETEAVNVPFETVSASPVLAEFLKSVVPTAVPDVWAVKNRLVNEGRPTVAGVLLFSEDPQAALPKHSGIKIYQYKTTEPEGFRAALAFNPITVEGCLNSQIKESVRLTTGITESIPRLGESQLETIRYPNATLHEIIANAVIHRDYSIADDVHIRIFENRIEVQSPGRLPAHITPENIMNERFARNGIVVRILNKFPDAPNKDVGEGLRTAFEAMNQLGLQQPTVVEKGNSVLVIIKHEPLASPEQAILEYLRANSEIRNSTARQITNIKRDHQIKGVFGRMVRKGLIEQVPGTRTFTTAYRLPLVPNAKDQLTLF